ncbi:AAA family ATPase [Streptomyces sp. CA2R106]|uniref:AAA family ATPase n=1 Tax=Streptomyces sp. CA2R106 TaxID=3120153 RepID=UPI00300807C2
MPFITRVRIDNYKSIAHCDVRLGRFTVLFGLNAAGKSNFLDALHFVRDAVTDGPSMAVAERGGVEAVLRRVPVLAASFTIGLEFYMPMAGEEMEPHEGRYEITIAPQADSDTRRSGGAGVRIDHEVCEIRPLSAAGQAGVQRFSLHDRGGKTRQQPRLGLAQRAGDEPFTSLYESLTAMFFYDPSVSVLRHASSAFGKLYEDGGSLGPALAALGNRERDRVSQYLGAIVPGVVEVGPTDPSADYVAARISIATESQAEPHVFRAESMSEGTIRAIGLLTALFQPDARSGWIPLVAVEEPELALHPLAAGALYDALTEASEHVQVLATTQSAELFDRKEANLSAIRVVVTEHGQTVIGEVDPVSRSIVADGLATTAELLRSNQLRPVVDRPGPTLFPDQPEGEE